MDRAYSKFEVKSIDEDKRIITGIATSPSPDRMDDIVEPLGAKFSLPLPLLWMHDSKQPVGNVIDAKVSKNGITVTCQFEKVDEPPSLKDRLDTAWVMVKAKLVRGLSIGFNPLESSNIDGSRFGRRFISWEWLELSAVTVPAHQDASITSIKSIDIALLAASGQEQRSAGTSPSPGVPGKPIKAASRGFSLFPKGIEMKTIAEQIAALEAARAAKTARMSEIMQKSMDEGRSTDAAEAEEFDTIESEVKLADADLIRLRELEKLNVQQAKAVTPENTATPARASETRGGVLFVKDNLPKGTAFTRYVIAMANGRGSLSDALKFAERWQGSTPQVAEYIKAAAGTTTGANWAMPLVDQANLAGEFIELLMPGTIIGKIAGLRKVPFNVKIPVQTGGSLVNWVGEAAAKPVGELAFDSITLGINKVAGIVVLTDELVKLSTPNAETFVRDDLMKQVTKFLDAQFIDPTVTASAGVRPASVTNGVTPVTSSGTSADAFRADLRSLRAAFRATHLSTAGAVLILNTLNADALADMVNPLGQPEFPGLTTNGGNVRGASVIVSDNVTSDSDGGIVVMLLPSEILLADDGVTVIDASREATLDMAGGNSPAFNLWQKNCVGIRAERWITWKKARAEAVQYISAANYGEATS